MYLTPFHLQPFHGYHLGRGAAPAAGMAVGKGGPLPSTDAAVAGAGLQVRAHGSFIMDGAPMGTLKNARGPVHRAEGQRGAHILRAGCDRDLQGRRARLRWCHCRAHVSYHRHPLRADPDLRLDGTRWAAPEGLRVRPPGPPHPGHHHPDDRHDDLSHRRTSPPAPHRRAGQHRDIELVHHRRSDRPRVEEDRPWSAASVQDAVPGNMASNKFPIINMPGLPCSIYRCICDAGPSW